MKQNILPPVISCSQGRLAAVVILVVISLLMGGNLFEVNGTTVNPHGSLDLGCESCHTSSDWKTLKKKLLFNHTSTGFPLENRHDGPGCTECHNSLDFSIQDNRCSSCHTDIHDGLLGDDCQRCHSTTGWIDPLTLRHMHDQTDFPLIGTHSTVDCQACHTAGQYRALSIECSSCHYDSYLNTTDPSHADAGFSVACNECHGVSSSSWNRLEKGYVHPASFPLTGGHNLSECSVCHLPGVSYASVPRECFGCHEQVYRDAPDPDHDGSAFPVTCEQCHTINSWLPAEYDHTLSSFQLTGAHLLADCSMCHSAGYTGTPSECMACHASEFSGAANPVHSTPSFDLDCSVCHTTTAWQPSFFDHNVQTSYLIEGAHLQLDCGVCHSGGIYAGTSSECIGCHREDYLNVEDPDHQQDGYPENCLICHTQFVWTDIQFNHDLTEFPLTGAHQALDCNDCHSNGYEGTPIECIGCHQADFDEVEEPIHVIPSFDVDCLICHTTEAWSPSTFNHDIQTDFVLEGSHTSITCNQCHVDGQYDGTPQTCYGCHQADYEGVDDPNHVSEGYSQNCTICHNQSDWEEVEIDHDQTAFPLTGAHRTVDCNDCHTDGYSGTPTECFACHEGQFNSATDPRHEQPEFDPDCAVCHTTESWEPSTFDHNSYTDYLLEEAHTELNCNLCHALDYDGTPRECWGCHESDFESAVPVHVQPSFDENCVLCHSQAAWIPSSFDHNTQTDYPLTGAHNGVTCALCHVNGQYENTPQTCFFCHESDYNNTDDPDHSAAGFPTDCELCHTTSNWDDANFDHDALYFPIYSGRHRNEWTSCTDCHIGGNYNDFSCIDCHEHNRNDMDDEHGDVQGYVYESHACYECHPDGEADDRLKSRFAPIENRRRNR